jgi:hypothetical protein
MFESKLEIRDIESGDMNAQRNRFSNEALA